MKKKEASARIKINRLLEEAGWRFFDDENESANIQLEPNVKMSKADLTGLGENFDKVKNGFVDFLLLDDKGKPFIVLEAKAEDKDPLVGKEQAREYAKSLYLKYVILSNGNQHYFWNIYKGNPQLITAFPSYESIRESKAMNADPAKLYSEEIGADYIAVIKNPRYMEAPEYINPETRQQFLYDNGLRFLRQYQINALKALQESVRHGNQRFLFEMATGTGKTLTSAAVIRLFWRSGNANRVLFLVDRIELENQAKKNFQNYLAPDYHTVIFKENVDDWRKAEGIEKMTTNPNLPQLFRDILRGAYIPYRDPDTLNMFLKEVSDFSYDNSEDLGNAFEYLLSIMGSQGDAGQFRTPRHIIDMMVEIVDPKKNETILDPACGTAGFLISAYRHILAQNKDEDGKSTLTADDRKRLTENFAGYDISPDMVRLSRVNMYLHHFTKPKISEYDTLTSEEKWDDCYDVILANPPFMTPKGGIMPHNRYRVKAKRSEVLFVDYIAEHLNPNGRAAIIVPEGIVFQSANAYKELRKYLVDDGLLYAVISLPAGVFNPYSGVKTSILLIDKSFARIKDEILFMKLNNDGFDLGAQRREKKGNDIPEIIRIIKKYHADLEPQTADDEILHYPLVTIASKEQISRQDYILVGELMSFRN